MCVRGRQRLASVSVKILKVWDVLQVKSGNFFCGGWKGTVLQESCQKNMLFWIWLEATMRKWLNLTDRTTISKQIVLNGSYLHVSSLRRMPYLRHGLYAATKRIFFFKKNAAHTRGTKCSFRQHRGLICIPTLGHVQENDLLSIILSPIALVSE